VRGESRIKNIFGENAHVNITSFNRKVLLTGEARDAETKQSVEREIAAIQNVASVANELEIADISNYTSRSNDTLITTKVKASFVDQKDLSVNVLKVVTERSVVYLMGRVTTSEGKLAGEVASGVAGVRKVVKLFEYINQDEMNRKT
jgi:osmotically-inducible protein OsmY